MLSLLITTSCVASAILALVYARSLLDWRARTRGRPLPPGPRPIPFIGNMLDTPKFKAWEGYRALCARYGNIMHLEVLGRHILVLGSAEVISEYLEKRAANSSDRAYTPLVELVGAHINFAFIPYGQWWRRHRRAFWQYFHPTVISDYRPIQRASAHRFLHRLLTDPSQFQKHIRYTFSAAIVKVIYHNDVETDIENQMTWVDQAQDGISQGLPPGKFLVEFMPFLQHLPSYFLGPELRFKSPQWRSAAGSLKEVAIARVKEEMHDSVVGKLLRKISQYAHIEAVYQEEEDIVKNVAAVALLGTCTSMTAAHTHPYMFSSVQTTFLAMSLYPEVLKKAQAELDAVVGPNRLPDWEDRGSLPYVNAIVKESLRWQNVIPLSVPHCTVADDEFHGYFIPAGTVIVPNTWACMHDPEVYEDPESYRPERFLKDGQLDPTVLDPSTFVFGYGRRICPGRYYAENGLFINTASLLHVFDLTPAIGEGGKPIKIEPQMSDGLVTYPEDCRCTIKPRSAWADALILGARENAYAGNTQ
ncbi:CyP450 monooxygenase [Fomes fomentarius]|nr:CyP450 monooxygenase [Fomes fomentarius]